MVDDIDSAGHRERKPRHDAGPSRQGFLFFRLSPNVKYSLATTQTCFAVFPVGSLLDQVENAYEGHYTYQARRQKQGGCQRRVAAVTPQEDRA